MYRLKKNVADFTVVDGPFAGRTFRAGKVYAEIPPQEKHKFEEDRKPAPAAIRNKGTDSKSVPGIGSRDPSRKNEKQDRPARH